MGFCQILQTTKYEFLRILRFRTYGFDCKGIFLLYIIYIKYLFKFVSDFEFFFKYLYICLPAGRQVQIRIY